jgi:hypothetical protein
MQFFPRVGLDATTGQPTIPVGAIAHSWRQPALHARLPNVLHASGWEEDPLTGVFQYRPVTVDPDINFTVYGVQAYGAFQDQGAAGITLRIQWETMTDTALYSDPTTGIDNNSAPSDLREYAYVLLPSPQGTGRLVRVHAAIAGTTTPTAGNRVGDWITDPTASRGWVIDTVLSDHVAHISWMTRRHDRSLGVNQVRVRIVFARVLRDGADASLRTVRTRIVTQVFSMRARNEQSDISDAQQQTDALDPLFDITP